MQQPVGVQEVVGAPRSPRGQPASSRPPLYAAQGMAGTVTVFKALALCWSLCTVCLCQPGDPFGDLPRKQPAWQAGQSSYK